MDTNTETALRLEAMRIRDNGRPKGPMKAWMRRQLIEKYAQNNPLDEVQKVVEEILP